MKNLLKHGAIYVIFAFDYLMERALMIGIVWALYLIFKYS